MTSRPLPPLRPARALFLGAAIAIFFALTFAALAQTAPAAPTETERAAPLAALATPPAATAPAPAPQPDAAAPGAIPAAPVAPQVAAQPALSEAAAVEPKKDDDPPRRASRSRRSHRSDNDRVSVMGETRVEAGELIEGAAVGVMADVLVDGEVTGDAVAVMGDNRINGTVGGNAVAVLGDIFLGPKAKIGGDLVCVGGNVHREPGAEVGGMIVKKSIGNNKHFGPGFENWWNSTFKVGRPLAFGRGLGWLWMFAMFLLAFYAVLALVFPGGVRRTGDMLVRRPFAVIMSAMLSIIALPVLFILLLVTVVGIPVALLILPLGVVLGVLFGKAAIYGLVGRGLTADKFHPVIAVLTGGLLFLLLNLVPVAGLLLSLVTSFLGFGCVVTALLSGERKSPPPPAAPPVLPAAPMPPPMSAPAAMAADVTAPPMAFAAAAGTPAGAPATFVPGPMTMPAPETAPLPPYSPPVIPVVPAAAASVPVADATMPRAGFWLRTGALFIDGVIIGACFAPWIGPGILPVLALYGALMWKFRGTTVGGIVCGLQVVRLDDRPIDWPTAVVRSLGCFLSLVVVGLGFVWVAFDDEKQSWHDKIAGTTVVRPPKRVSLV